MRIQKMALAALAVTAVGVTPTPAKAQSTSDIIETVGAMILADRLGIDPNLIMMTQMNSGSSIFDMAPAIAMGAYGQADPLQVLTMQNMGMGWNDIARAGNVPAPIFSTLVNTRQLDSNAIWADELGSRYSVSQSYLEDLNRSGYSWREIAQASVDSQRTGRPIEDVLYENRLFSSPNYGYSSPIYVPERRTTRYVDTLPPPRREWEVVSPVVWVDQVRRPWRPPVYSSWSQRRIERDPVFVRLGNSHNYRLVDRPIYVRAKKDKKPKKHYVRYNAPRIDFQRPIYYAKDTPNRWVYRASEDRRAQRFVIDQDRRREWERRQAREAYEDRKRDEARQRRWVAEQRRDEQRRREDLRERKLREAARERNEQKQRHARLVAEERRERQRKLSQAARERYEKQRRHARLVAEENRERQRKLSDLRDRRLQEQRRNEDRRRQVIRDQKERNERRFQKERKDDQRKRIETVRRREQSNDSRRKRLEPNKDRRRDDNRREHRRGPKGVNN